MRDSSAKRCVLSGIKVDGRAELSENMVDRLAAQTQGGVSSFPPTVCTWSGGIVRDRHLFGEMGIANATLLIPCTHTHTTPLWPSVANWSWGFDHRLGSLDGGCSGDVMARAEGSTLVFVKYFCRAS